VRATDPAGNQGNAAAFEWTVDNSLADTTPPQTTILSKPPNPSDSSTASFTYESNEPGSSFECELDGTGFAACPAAGIAYTSLANGSHTFQVRAIDPSANVDPTPAGYSFDVAVPQPQPMVTAPPAPPGPEALAPVVSKPPQRHRRHRRCRRVRHHHGKRCPRGGKHRHTNHRRPR
jgi:hypothetical protein